MCVCRSDLELDRRVNKHDTLLSRHPVANPLYAFNSNNANINQCYIIILAQLRGEGVKSIGLLMGRAAYADWPNA